MLINIHTYIHCYTYIYIYTYCLWDDVFYYDPPRLGHWDGLWQWVCHVTICSSKLRMEADRNETTSKIWLLSPTFPAEYSFFRDEEKYREKHSWLVVQ